MITDDTISKNQDLSITSIDHPDTSIRDSHSISNREYEELIRKIENHERTEQILMETIHALQISEGMNRNLIENSADSIKVINIKGDIITINESGRKILEFDQPSKYRGKKYEELWPSPYAQLAHDAIHRAISGKTTRFQGSRPTAKGHMKWWDVVIAPIFDTDQHVTRLLAISRDISIIKELDQNKEDFLSAAGHELKTPLTGQKAYIQLLLREIEKNQDTKYLNYITKIHEQTNKLTKFINDLLALSKLQSGRMQIKSNWFDLTGMVKKSIHDIQASSPHHAIRLHGKIINKIYGDEEKIYQVMMGILSNSIKYSLESNRIDVYMNTSSHHANVSVKDHGIGIRKREQKRIFERFYRIKNPTHYSDQGLGLGLYIASEIIKKHDGLIDVKSTVGKGSTFSFSLPLRQS